MSSGNKDTFGRTSLLGLLPGILIVVFLVLATGHFSISGIVAANINNLFSSYFLSTVGYSIWLSFVSTFFSLLFGLLLALWLWKQPLSFPSQIFTTPLIFPHIVAAFFVIVFFSQSGLLSSLLTQLGIIKELSEFPILVFDRAGIGIILAYIYKETAFVTLLVLASLRTIPEQLLQSANMLGAKPFRILRTILLPHISSSIWVSGIIIFLYSFSAFDIPFLLGSSSQPMVTIEAYRLIFDGSLSQRSQAHLLLFVIWGISMVFLIVFIFLRSFFSHRNKKAIWI